MDNIRLLKELMDRDYGSIKDLMLTMQSSESSIRDLINRLRNDGRNNGFEIKVLRGRGYYVEVTSHELLKEYLRPSIYDLTSSKRTRQDLILQFLLQQTTFVSMEHIGNRFLVSKNTLQRDINDLRDYLHPFDVIIEGKSHYGIKLVGDENQLRKLFAQHIVKTQFERPAFGEYFSFLESVNIDMFNDELIKIFESNHLALTKQTFDSISQHILILIHRIRNDNLIQSFDYESEDDSQSYEKCASEIARYLTAAFDVILSAMEVKYLALQISGKTMTQSIPSVKREALAALTSEVMQEIDCEFLTQFSKNKGLCDSIMFHMYPLLSRVSNNMELRNPLVDTVTSRYANVFLVALRFIEIWNTKGYGEAKLIISKDEMGYLALHFASHLEKVKQETLDNCRRILVVSSTGRGSLALIKEKLQRSFPTSMVSTSSGLLNEPSKHDYPDLIISDNTSQDFKFRCPVYFTKGIIDEIDVEEIKDFLILRGNTKDKIDRSNWIDELLSEDLYIKTDEIDYLNVLEEVASAMVAKSKAAQGFPKSVIEREMRYTTIYVNGVAGPHGMEMNALEDAIAIIIPTLEMMYTGKVVNLIFLINLQQGSLFMYREISKLISNIMESPDTITRIRDVSSFGELKRVLKSIK